MTPTERPTAPATLHPRGCVCYVCEGRAPGDVTAATLRPTAPDDCRAFPQCGLDLRGECRCHPVAAPTVPAPGPCQQRALIDALHRADGIARDVRQASMALAEGARREAWAVYLRERAARG